MTVLTGATLSDVGIETAAIKPTEVQLDRVHGLDVERLTVDYEGREHVPEPAALDELAGSFDVRATIPVRADGFDPRGDQTERRRLPDSVGEVLVAGHPAYLDEDEQNRAIAPRLAEGARESTDPWVGTEGIERIALAVGGTQFELLSRNTTKTVRGLRSAGFDGEIAVYAPVVLSSDEDTILDAVGAYAARRRPVRNALPDGAVTDSEATGRAREVLTTAVSDFALVGSPETVADRVSRLQDLGVDHVVGYPARGLDPLLE